MLFDIYDELAPTAGERERERYEFLVEPFINRWHNYKKLYEVTTVRQINNKNIEIKKSTVLLLGGSFYTILKGDKRE